MIFIINPSVNGFNFYSIYALIAVFLITLRDLITRNYLLKFIRYYQQFLHHLGFVVFDYFDDQYAFAATDIKIVFLYC